MKDGEVQEIVCNFCGSDQYTPFDKEGEWKIVTCKNCGFHYTNPQPTPAALPFYYTEEYFKDKRHYAKFYNEDGSTKIQAEAYTNRIQDAETFVDERGRLLEIGSARGGYLGVMKKRGWNVEGVEISADAAAIANQNGIETFVGVFEDYLPSEPIQVICLYQTLEHVHDPMRIISKSHEILAEKGLFIAEIPNIKCFELKYSKTRRHLSYDLPRHLNHFSPDFLKKALEKAGFDVIDIDLYPPKFLLRLLGFIQKLKSSKSPTLSRQLTDEEIVETSALPLLKKTMDGKKVRIIRSITKVFPGWRFTITARKKSA